MGLKCLHPIRFPARELPPPPPPKKERKRNVCIQREIYSVAILDS